MTSQTKNTFTRPKPNSEPEKENRKLFNAKISLTTVITVSVLFLICFGWSFVLGVMVGRDYDPKTLMPELVKVLPLSTTKGQVQLTDEELKQTSAEIAQLDKVDTKALAENEESQIIDVEELNFSSSLKGKPGEGKLASTPSDMRQNKVQSLPEPVAVKPRTNTEIKTIADSPVTKQIMPRMPQIVPDSTQEEQKVYNFVIQVATLRDMNAVDRLRAELEGYDLRTRMEEWQGEKFLFYRVIVVLRGTEAKARELDKIFNKLRLGRAILREKSLVER